MDKQKQTEKLSNKQKQIEKNEKKNHQNHYRLIVTVKVEELDHVEGEEEEEVLEEE